MLALYLLAWFVLRETAAGRHVYAVGNNAEATRLVGIPTQRVLLGVYVIAGLFYGIASLLSVARTGVGDPNAGQTENLDAITAVVLGGTSLFGGRGIILGTLVGALIVGVFRNGLTLMGVSSIYQVLVTGILVILAVAWTNCRAREVADHERTNPRDAGLQGLVKRYGQVTALDGADFELRAGEILAVIGDNGAGKSSLIKCLSGATVPDEGEILLDGQPVQFKSPIDARRAGIEWCYQDLAVAPAMTIAENLFLGRELRRPGLPATCCACWTRRRCSRAIARMQDLKVGIRSMTQAVETLCPAASASAWRWRARRRLPSTW
jgi:hypothetical protein